MAREVECVFRRAEKRPSTSHMDLSHEPVTQSDKKSL